MFHDVVDFFLFPLHLSFLFHTHPRGFIFASSYIGVQVSEMLAEAFLEELLAF